MANKKKQKGKLTYFLDHPQIKRHKSPGNGESPSTNEKDGFFNQLKSGKLSNPGGSEKKLGSNKNEQTSWQKAFSKGFRGD